MLSYEGETGGVVGPGGGRGAAPLPLLGLPQIAAVSASPFSQRAHDGVGDVGGGIGGLGVGARSGQGDGSTQAGLPGRRRAVHSHSSSRPLPSPLLLLLLLVPVARSLLQDSLHVAPEAALWAVVAAGEEFGDLEGRVGLPLTAPLNGLQFAANAVHGVVTAGGLGCVDVHAAGCRAAGPASWLETAKSGRAQKNQGLHPFNNSLVSGRSNETSKKYI